MHRVSILLGSLSMYINVFKIINDIETNVMIISGE
jgi:hypothetical protein